MTKANDDIAAYKRIARQLHEIHRYYSSVVDEANTIEDVKISAGRHPILYGEFKDSTIFELTRRYVALEKRIDISNIDPLFFKHNVGGSDFTYSLDELARYGGIITGTIKDDYSNDEITSMKEFISNLWQHKRRLFAVIIDSEHTPRCPVHVLIAQISGYESQHIRAYPARNALP